MVRYRVCEAYESRCGVPGILHDLVRYRAAMDCLRSVGATYREHTEVQILPPHNDEK